MENIVIWLMASSTVGILTLILATTILKSDAKDNLFNIIQKATLILSVLLMIVTLVFFVKKML